MKRTGLCRIGLHKWAVRRDPDVKPYVACKRCNKEKMVDLRPETMAGGAEGKMFSSFDKDE